MKEFIMTIKFKVKEENLNHKFLTEMKREIATGGAVQELSVNVPVIDMSVTLEENKVTE
jgi:translation initiation factor 1 (eIF-1/SUI1)